MMEMTDPGVFGFCATLPGGVSGIGGGNLGLPTPSLLCWGDSGGSSSVTPNFSISAIVNGGAPDGREGAGGGFFVDNNGSAGVVLARFLGGGLPTRELGSSGPRVRRGIFVGRLSCAVGYSALVVATTAVAWVFGVFFEREFLFFTMISATSATNVSSVSALFFGLGAEKGSFNNFLFRTDPDFAAVWRVRAM
jgi:hypothetical protein